MRALLAALLLCAAPAMAHDDAQWIQDRGYKNGLGELCCGPRDCRRLADGDVAAVPGGHRINSLNEFVPTHETLPVSPDGYWVCVWSGVRKCFFAPAQGS